MFWFLDSPIWEPWQSLKHYAKRAPRFTKIRKGEAKGQNFKKMSPIDSARRALQNEYHIMRVLWIFAHGRVAKALGHHSKDAGSILRPKVNFFILLSKVIKIFACPYFYVGTRWRYYFSRKTFEKSHEKFFLDFLIFLIFPKVFTEK